MIDLKVEEYRACQEYETVGHLRARIKYSNLYDGFEKRTELVKLLEELHSYILDKIES